VALYVEDELLALQFAGGQFAVKRGFPGELKGWLN
jgi:hypothetical protein